MPRVRGMHSRLLVSGLPRSLPPLSPLPAPPCLPCVKGRQCAAPHSLFPPTSAPLLTLHMDVWGPARVGGQGRERYFLLVVDNYTRYTTVFPLRRKGQVVDVLIPWIRAVRLQFRERFRADLPVLRLHSDRGGEFSSDLLRDFIARTSMIHAAAPHFLWPFAVWYAAHQLNLWPRVSFPETSPTLCWTGKVGDESVFQVWGSRALVRDTSANKLSARAILCVFLGFTPDAHGWQFYHPTSRRVFPSQDVTFDESVPFYRLFPYRSTPPPPPPLFLAPGPPLVDPLPPKGPAPSCLSEVDPLPCTAPVEVAVGSGAARGAASRGVDPGVVESEGARSGGAEPGGEEPGSAERAGVEPGGAEPEGVEPGGAELEGAESGGAEPQGAASSRGPAGALPRLSPKQLREWLVRRARLHRGATGAGGAGAAGSGGAGVTARAGGTGGTVATGPGGARTRGTGAAGTGGVGGAGGGDPTEPGAAGAGGFVAGGVGAGGAGAGGTGAGGAEAEGAGAGGTGAGAGGAGVGGTRAGGAGAGGTGAGGVGAGGAGAVLGVPSSTSLTPPLLCPPPNQSQLPLQPASPLPPPSLYTEQSGGLTERHEPASCPVSPVRTARRVPRSRPPPVPGTHAMALRPSSVPLRVPLPAPPESFLPAVPDPESNHARATSPIVSRLLATTVTEPSFESAAVSALIAELLDFVAACHLDYATALVVESASASPPSVGGECALGTDVLEDRQEDFGCLAIAVPRLASMLLAPEGDLDAPDIPTLTTLAALGFAPSTADSSLFLRTDTSLPPFYVLVYVNDLVFGTVDSEALTLVNTELHKRHTCTDLGELRSYLGLQITRDRARRTITLTHTSGMGLMLGGRGPLVLTGHADASWVDDSTTQRSSQGYIFSLGSSSVSSRSTRSSSVLSSTCEAEIYTGAMAAQELRWLTYLQTDLGEQPCSPPVLYVDNKAMIALCQEHRLEHRTKHIALRYFLARELQQRGQLCLAYVAIRANTADIFTKALPPGDHQRFSTVLGLVPTLPHLLTA
ncbi:unnamed protein product [Closterium sp. NIES-54]